MSTSGNVDFEVRRTAARRTTAMIRTQVQFDEQLYERIRSLAHRNRISMAEVVRRLVRSGLRAGLEAGEPTPDAGALLELAGIGRSGLRDLGRRHDEYFIEEVER
jgi:hypothetical protein